jgi:hypothetical protein
VKSPSWTDDVFESDFGMMAGFAADGGEPLHRVTM